MFTSENDPPDITTFFSATIKKTWLTIVDVKTLVIMVKLEEKGNEEFFLFSYDPTVTPLKIPDLVGMPYSKALSLLHNQTMQMVKLHKLISPKGEKHGSLTRLE